MRDIQFALYQLEPLQALNAKVQSSNHLSKRHGALLKVIWDDGLVGFADLHPWTELGDLSLDEQLKKIPEGRFTNLSHSSLWLARRDAEARFADRNLLPPKGTLKNNALVSVSSNLTPELLHDLKMQGFDTIKIKAGKDLKSDLHHLRIFQGTSWKLRLDFNNLLSENSYAEFMASLPKEVRDHIEYVEDPFSYQQKSWSQVRKWAPLAVDQDLSLAINYGKPGFDVLILKPAKSDVAETVQYAQTHDCKITVTSYMDHPVGVVHAMSVAEDLKKEFGDMILEAGCLTHSLFSANDFSTSMFTDGPYLNAVKEMGVGFDSQLEALSWQKLARP